MFAANGVEDVLGIDGDWVPRDMLAIPEDRFRPFDLSKPYQSAERYDLAMSFEVAEHLPGSSAPAFVASLVRLAPVVLFAAAVPGQGGTGHINEQWPNYWAELFAEHGYEVLDPVRAAIWNLDSLAPCIRQNTLMYASGGRDRVE